MDAQDPPPRAAAGTAPVPASELLALAKSAARWIRSTQIETGRGQMWPIDPTKPDTTSADLYSGAPGVILFFLELHRSTGDRMDLWDARQGATALLTLIAESPDLVAKGGGGLYVGLGGVAYALNETARATGDESFRRGANQCIDLIIANAHSQTPAASWSDVTDVISGQAGTGFVLLYAAREMGRDDALALACEAGDSLLAKAVVKNGGLMWRMGEEVPNTYPNFSHGTAGICTFLAALSETTKEQKYLDAAVKGARYLISIADTQDDRCLVPRFDPSEYAAGEAPLYYYGWCHGPAGTGGLFHALHEATGDEEWATWRDRAAKALLDSGIAAPGAGVGARLPGFWNNVGWCCGNAGIARFALAMHRETGDGAYLDFADRLTRDLVDRAARNEGAGHVMWFHAEHRVEPDNVAAQTGLMQGAAGIGLWLLERRAHQSGREFGTRLPDDAFGWK